MAAVAIRLVRCSRARSVLIGLIAVAASAMLGVESSAAATVFNSTTTLTSNTTWSVAGSPYILNADVKVDFGVTLTINPGVVVKLNGTSRSMVIWGTMTAIGSAANPIVFTSLKDDSVGGDDGSDGPTVGTPGDWYNLQFSSGNALSYLQHVDVRFGSWGSPGNGAISLSRSAPYAPNPNQPTTVTVEDSSIHDGQQGGFYVYESNLVLRRSSVFGNGDGGIYASSGSVVADQNSITGNGARGVQILLGSSYQGAQSRLTRNTVTQNGRTGVHLFLDPGIPFANYPTGAGNNIFGNQTNQTGTAQMDIGAAPSGGAGQNPWAGNY